MKREFLMLAKSYDPSRQLYSDWLWSRKLDGMRCFWDGGISRGMHVPWADKPATGLWSRYMKPIHGLDEWINNLPPVPLDGELWAGVGNFQKVMSICRRHIPDERWWDITFMAFDIPPLSRVFEIGLIENSNCNVYLTQIKIDPLMEAARKLLIPWDNYYRFHQALQSLFNLKKQYSSNIWQPVVQNVVSDWKAIVEVILPKLLDDGHEGLMLRRANNKWENWRSTNLLKYKPYKDSEAIIIAILPGKGKHEGRMGALSVHWPETGQDFDLGVGFTDEERERSFPIGTKITFKYRELTEDQRPKEARYWRINNA